MPAHLSDRVLVVRWGGLRRAVPLHLVLEVRQAGPAVRLPGVPPGSCNGSCNAIAHGREVIPLLTHPGDPPVGPEGYGRGGTGQLVAVVRRAGHPVALGIAGIEGVHRMADADAPALDVDALAVPAARPRTAPGGVISHGAAAVTRPAPAGLRLGLGARALWLPPGQVARVLAAATPIPVPWAPPLMPAVQMVGGVPVPLLRLDLLLGLPAPAAGPVVVCHTRHGMAAFTTDRVDGLHPLGAEEALDLDAMLGSVLAAGDAAASRLPAVAAGPPGTDRAR